MLLSPVRFSHRLSLKKIKPTYTNLDLTIYPINITFFFLSWDVNLQKTGLCNLERKENMLFKITKRGLENIVIKFASPAVRKNKIIKTKELQNFKGRLKCKIKSDCLLS